MKYILAQMPGIMPMSIVKNFYTSRLFWEPEIPTIKHGLDCHGEGEVSMCLSIKMCCKLLFRSK